MSKKTEQTRKNNNPEYSRRGTRATGKKPYAAPLTKPGVGNETRRD